MGKVYSVFYSWQSDLPKETNLNAIRQCLRVASNLIENEIDDVRIELDEATRNTTGSPNIPKTIFEKINESHIFICDLTTINTDSPKQFRKVPNPNVLIELGYAVSCLGWERIIMLFNKAHGVFPSDLPFDIDRHRSTPFSIEGKKDISGKRLLEQVLKNSIQSIIEQDPLKPKDRLSIDPTTKKRNNDIKNLERILSCIHVPTFDLFLREIPDTIIGSIYSYKEYFLSIFYSNTFHIYNENLSQTIERFKDYWVKSLSYYQHYDLDRHGKDYDFYFEADRFPSVKAEIDYQKLVLISTELENSFKELLLSVREHYLEIDLEQTSEAALKKFHDKSNIL